MLHYPFTNSIFFSDWNTTILLYMGLDMSWHFLVLWYMSKVCQSGTVHAWEHSPMATWIIPRLEEAYTFKYPYTYLSYKKENNYFVIIPLIWWFFRAKHCKNGVLQLLPIKIWLWVASLAQIKPRKFVT